jgi:hypothetical protein
LEGKTGAGISEDTEVLGLEARDWDLSLHYWDLEGIHLGPEWMLFMYTEDCPCFGGDQ